MFKEENYFLLEINWVLGVGLFCVYLFHRGGPKRANLFDFKKTNVYWEPIFFVFPPQNFFTWLCVRVLDWLFNF